MRSGRSITKTRTTPSCYGSPRAEPNIIRVLLLRRAGLITPKEFLEGKASTIKQLQARPGRFETSLEDASFDAWIKYYRPDENAVNNQISYYDKGEIVNMMLDITIRTATGGARSLDDVMRYLYNEYFKKGKKLHARGFSKDL